MPRKLTEDRRWLEPGPQKFSDAYLRWLQAGGAAKGKEGKEFLVFEAGESGLAIRVPPNKRLRFLFQRRQEDGKTFRCPLGRYPGVSLATAKKRAEVLAGEQSSGANLRMTRPTRRSRRAARIGIPTLAETVKAWKSGNPDLRPSYLDFVEKGMFRVFNDLLPRQIDAITFKELEARWELLEGGPARCVASRWAHSIFNWAVKKYEEHNISNPLAGRLLPKAPPPRTQYLTGEQMRAVYATAGELGEVRGGLVRFSMLTLVRRSEAVQARWAEFNVDLTEWHIPAGRMKGGRHPHFVPLPPAARSILRSLGVQGRDGRWRSRHEGCDFVFTFDGEIPATGFSHTKKVLDRAIAREALPDFTVHDFRRSGTTWLVRNGVNDAAANMLLAHKPHGRDKIKAVYNVYDYEAERRIALEMLASFLTGESQHDESRLITLPPPPLRLPAPESLPPSRQFRHLSTARRSRICAVSSRLPRREPSSPRKVSNSPK